MSKEDTGRVLPILFITEMVQAILAGKSVTRRPIKPRYRADESDFIIIQNWGTGERTVVKVDLEGETFDKPRYVTPPYKPGDILYVRETWSFIPCFECTADSCGKIPDYYEDQDMESEGCYIYRAGHAQPERITWRPSIHMPKAAARIWLKVTDVWMERLQDITEEQARAEGAIRCYEEIRPDEDVPVIYESEDGGGYYTLGFKAIWNSTIKKSDMEKHGWDANPWVWTISFVRCEKPREVEE